MAAQAFCVVSWSGVHTARYNYTCALCGGDIAINDVYRSFVMSYDQKDPKHTAFRIQHHLNCAAPWYQPVDVNRLEHLGHMPRRNPPEKVLDPVLTVLPPITVDYRSKTAGHITWQLPQDVSQRIYHSKNLRRRTGALIQLRNGIATTAEAMMGVIGHRHESRTLGHLMYDMQLYSGVKPHFDYEEWGLEPPDEDYVEDL